MSEITEVPSPFCGIGSDDLTVAVDGLSLKVVENGCAVNTPAFEMPLQDLKPRVDGKEASLEQAVATAAKLLRDTNQPVYGGCATDVNGMRALLALADRNGAVVDQVKFNASRRNFLTLQDSGWMNTTLAEVKNRCDVLLCIGTDPAAFAPRFFEKFIWNQDSLFFEQTENRKVVFLGVEPSGDASQSPNGHKAEVLPCSVNELPGVVSALHALAKGRLIQHEFVGGIAIEALQKLVQQLQTAQYGVVTWSGSDLDYPQAELTVQSICELVKELNVKTRCSGLPLGGKEGDITASQVCGWITGYPARTRFAAGFPEYDPYLNDVSFFLSEGEADALLWVQAFNADEVPPRTDVPVIVVGRSGMQFSQEPDVFIPVGTPGIDHAGHVYRMDNVVPLRLKKLRDSGLPSTAEVLTAIEQAL